MNCFANTRIRVNTDNYFIGLSKCLLAIAVASLFFALPPPSPALPSPPYADNNYTLKYVSLETGLHP